MDIQTERQAAAVSLSIQNVHILLLGGGQGGLAMLDIFYRYRDWLHIDLMVDINLDAPGIQLARSLHIPTSSSTETSIAEFDGSIIVDMTGSKSVHQMIKLWKKRPSIEVISGNSARLVFDLVCRQREQKQTIQAQNLRLNLLNSMLDISLQLEQHKDASKVLKHAVEGIHNSLLARKSIVILSHKDQCQCFGILDVDMPENMPMTFFHELQARFSDFEQRDLSHQYFEFLDPPIQLPIIKDTFNLAIPLLQDRALLAVLLIQSTDQLDQTTRTMLSMAASHLRLAIKALESHQQLEAQAIRDALTKCYNRHYFDKHIHQEISRIKRIPHGQLSCMFFDMDHFKSINDLYSHHAGDEVLKAVATTIQNTLRNYDVFARFGGDEFIALLPFDEQSSNTTANDIAERILHNVKAIHLSEFPSIQVSISIGVATLHSTQLKDAKHLLKLADQAVYSAKEQGKGCVHSIKYTE